MGLVCLPCLHADLPTPRALPPSLPPSPFMAEYGLLAPPPPRSLELRLAQKEQL